MTNGRKHVHQNATHARPAVRRKAGSKSPISNPTYSAIWNTFAVPVIRTSFTKMNPPLFDLRLLWREYDPF